MDSLAPGDETPLVARLCMQQTRVGQRHRNRTAALNTVVSASSSRETPTTAGKWSSTPEVVIPRLHQSTPMLCHDALDCAQFGGSKPDASRDAHGVEP
jgi:hypothetical protein